MIHHHLHDVSYKNIILENHKIRFLNTETMIDLGAIAKGYIADQIKNYLLKENVKSALINLGGNILCVGKNKRILLLLELPTHNKHLIHCLV